MNKFIRGMLITFAVCLVVGGGLLIAGIALGGNWDDATVVIGENQYEVNDIIDHSLFKLKGRTAYSDGSDEPETVASTNEMTVDANDIRDLEIVLRNCELQILQSDDEQIYVSVEAEKEKYFSIRKDETENWVLRMMGKEAL